MDIGNGEVIEIQHPLPNDESKSFANEIRLHLGPIGSGKSVIKSDSSRINFVRANSLLATDVEMSPVLDSIIGNCHDSFILIKGNNRFFTLSKSIQIHICYNKALDRNSFY